MRRLSGLLCLVAAPAFAADVPKPADPSELLVRQLGVPRFGDRDAAMKELLRVGPAAVPALKAALAATANPEIRDRAETLLDQIARQTDCTRLIAAKSVKLDYTDKPLAFVVNDIKTKTGINLTLLPGKVANPTRPVTVVAPGEVPAWQAVELLMAQAGLREDFRLDLAAAPTRNSYYGGGFGGRVYYSDNGQNQVNAATVPVSLMDGKPDALSGSRETGVRVLVMPGRFPTNKIVRGAGRLLVTLDVTPTAGINWTEVSSVRIHRAEDEDGRPLLPDLKPVTDATNYEQNRWGGGGMWDDGNGGSGPQANPRLVTVALRTNDKAFKTLKRFEGVVLGEVKLLNMPLVTIDSVKDAAGKPAVVGPDELKLTISSYGVEKDGRTRVKVRIEILQQWVLQQRKQMAAGGGGAARWWGGGFSEGFNNVTQTLVFTDAAGKPVPTPNPTNNSYTSDGMHQTMDAEFFFAKPDKVGAPVKLVYRGTKLAPVEVPFRAANVQVP